MARLPALLEKFDALNQRERISIMSLLLVAILILFSEFLIFPVSDEYARIDNKISSVETKMDKLKNEIAILKIKKKSALSPKEKQKKKLNLLEEQVVQLNLRLKENMRGLIAPKEMPKVLEFVLNKSTDLELQGMQALASKPLTTQAEGAQPAENDLGIYHHGMQIRFSGTYLSTLAYLKALKDLPWDFYWDELELTTAKYPTSSVVLTIHTLSFHKDWIGV